jgi:hypothetical protein
MNGNVYAGVFKDGLKHGKGKWRKIFKGVKIQENEFEIYYEGDYESDKKNGYGEF